MPNLDRSSHRTALLLAVLTPVSLLLTGCGGPDLIERISQPQWGLCGTVVIILDVVAIFDLLGDERGTTGKVLWTLLIVFFPVGGVILYFLFGRE